MPRNLSDTFQCAQCNKYITYQKVIDRYAKCKHCQTIHKITIRDPLIEVISEEQYLIEEIHQLFHLNGIEKGEQIYSDFNDCLYGVEGKCLSEFQVDEKIPFRGRKRLEHLVQDLSKAKGH